MRVEGLVVPWRLSCFIAALSVVFFSQDESRSVGNTADPHMMEIGTSIRV
jgi:hypothetical protein